MPCDKGLAVSLSERSCGPVTNERSSRAPASGFSSGLRTISEPAMPARTFSPRNSMRSGSTPMKPPTEPSGAT
jgi:hypothetical protein